MDLFKGIAKFHPKDRIDIDKVTAHPFFDEVRSQENQQACRAELARLLRGNHGILSRSALDICELEVIGMKTGKEIFELLRTVVLFKTEEGYAFKHFFGGPQYFKAVSCTDSTSLFPDSARNSTSTTTASEPSPSTTSTSKSSQSTPSKPEPTSSR